MYKQYGNLVLLSFNFLTDCGIPNRGNVPTKKIGRSLTDIGEYPWQARIMIFALDFMITVQCQVGIMFDSPDLSRRIGCGGTLISNRHVLTHVECVDFDSYSDYVLLGDTAIGVDANTNRIIEISKYILHDDISINLVILELAEQAPLDQYPNIKPVCLPTSGADFSDFEGIVTGWAYNGVNGYNSWLHEFNVSVVEMDDKLTEKSGKNFCYGDTGSPLIVSDPVNNNGLTLIGVTDKNDCSSVLTFTKVSILRDWIDSVIINAATCPPPP